MYHCTSALRAHPRPGRVQFPSPLAQHSQAPTYVTWVVATVQNWSLVEASFWGCIRLARNYVPWTETNHNSKTTPDSRYQAIVNSPYVALCHSKFYAHETDATSYITIMSGVRHEDRKTENVQSPHEVTRFWRCAPRTHTDTHTLSTVTYNIYIYIYTYIYWLSY